MGGWVGGRGWGACRPAAVRRLCLGCLEWLYQCREGGDGSEGRCARAPPPPTHPPIDTTHGGIDAHAGRKGGPSPPASLRPPVCLGLGRDAEAFTLLGVSVAIAFAAVWLSEWFLRRRPA